MKQINEDIKSGNFRQVYLLCGEEIYLRTQYRKRLIDALVGDDTMNFTRFEGKNIDQRELLGLCDTMPFFADRRVILIENSGFFKNKAEELADYLKELPDYLVLVFSEDEVDKRSRLYKAAQKAGYICSFDRQDEKVRMRWVLGRLNKEKKKITQRDMELFLTLAGDDMSNLDKELEKLLCYTLDREVIREEDILAICSGQTTNQIFEMVRLVSAGEQKKALDLYHDLLFLREAPVKILFLITRQFHQLYIVKEMQADRKDQNSIAKTAGIQSFAMKRFLPIARQYTADQLKEAVRFCVQTEEDIKTGRIGDALGLELLIIRLSGR